MKSKLAIFVPMLLIRVYQWVLSPMKDCFFGPTVSCCYYPSCSEYGIESFKRHGLLKGLYLTVKRVCRCHPGCSGGIDMVPVETEK